MFPYFKFVAVENSALDYPLMLFCNYPFSTVFVDKVVKGTLRNIFSLWTHTLADLYLLFITFHQRGADKCSATSINLVSFLCVIYWLGKTATILIDTIENRVLEEGKWKKKLVMLAKSCSQLNTVLLEE